MVSLIPPHTRFYDVKCRYELEEELQVRMGHKSIKATMDIYAELAPKNQTQAVKDIYLNKIAELTS